MATLQSSGAISLGDIAGVMGGTAPHAISEYYRGGGLTPATTTTTSTTTTYQPTSGFYYTFNVYQWTSYEASYQTGLWWAGTRITTDGSGTSKTIGGWTYFRGSLRASQGGKDGYTRYEIRRQQTTTTTTTVDINTSVPSSGQISFNQFYGASK